MKCKALDYYHNLLEENDYDFEAIEDFLTQTNVGSSIYGDRWWEDSGEHFSGTFKKDFTSKEIFDMFDMYKPPNDITDEELEDKHSYNFLSYGDYAPKCQNTECEFHRGLNDYAWCGYSDWADQCIIDIVFNIQFAFEIGGWSAIDELRPQFNKKIINYICKSLPHDYIGIKEKELYGDDKMYFLEELSKIKQEDNLSVFWMENQMYVNDESDGQATETCSLFEAYKFSVLINADFDYTATDKEVKELSEELLDLIDEDFYRVNVWEYIDSISDDFEKLTGIQLGIDDKRGIVCGMTDDGAYDILCDFGSATYIAKLLWRYIKGDNNIKMMNGDLLFKGCDNPIANELAEKHLMSDDYDLKEFARALHKVTQTNWIVPTSFNDYLDKTYGLTCKCYWLGTSLLSAKKDFNETFVVGRINWQGDWEKPIYCHIDSYENIWFEANGVRSATLYDVMLPHLMIGKDIKEFALKLTEDNFIKICKKYDLDGKNINDSVFGYIHCTMYGAKGHLEEKI